MKLHFGLCFCMLTLLSQSAFASPFESSQRVCLEDLSADGDLNYRFTLFSLQLDESESIEIRIEHNLRTIEYGSCKSVLSIRPLNTSLLSPDGNNRLRWRKPNGREVILRHDVRDNISTAKLTTLPQVYRDLLCNRPKVFNANGAIAFVTADFQSGLLFESGWWLRYEKGQLLSFCTPDKNIFEVKNIGGTIRSIKKDGEEVLSYDFISNTEALLTTPDHVVRLRFNENGSVVSMEKENAQWVYDYDEKGLLYLISEPGKKREFSWMKSPRRPLCSIDWIKPVYLKTSSNRVFTYICSDSSIELKTLTPPLKSTKLKVRYGTVVSIKVEHEN